MLTLIADSIRFDDIAVSSCRRVAVSLAHTGLYLILGVLLTCCGDKTETSSWNGRVRIALVAPLTGPLSDEGQMLQFGALLAMKESGEEKPGLRAEMIVYDSPCSDERAVSVARQVSGDPSICTVIGYLCAESVRAVLPVYREAGLALISPTVSAEQIREDHGRHLFPLIFGGGEQASFLAAYIRKGLGVKRVAAVSDQSDYGKLLMQSFLNEAEKQNLDVVARVVSAPEAAGAAVAVQLLKSSDPQAIFLAAFPTSARLILLERRRQKLAGHILGPDFLADSDLYEMTASASEGLLVCQPLLLGSNVPEVAGFVERFKRFHKRQPDWIAAGGYDAIHLVLEVLRRTGPGRAAVLRGLKTMSRAEAAFKTLGGPLFFMKDGGNRSPFYVARMHQGTLQPAEPSTVDFEVTTRP